MTRKLSHSDVGNNAYKDYKAVILREHSHEVIRNLRQEPKDLHLAKSLSCERQHQRSSFQARVLE